MVYSYTSHWPFKEPFFIARICCPAADHTRAAEDFLCSLYRAGLWDLLSLLGLLGPSDLLDLYDLSDLLHPEAACLLGLALDSHASVTEQVAAHGHRRHLGCSFDPAEVPGDLAGLVLMHIASMAGGQRAAVPE